MKKSLKSAIALFLCMLLLLPTVLTGCGETASPTAMQTEAPTDAPTEASTVAPTEAPTVDISRLPRGEIVYNEDKLAISVSDEITPALFDAYYVTEEGKLAEIDVAVNGKQEAGKTVTVRFSVQEGSETKQVTVRNIKVYGTPSLSLDESVKQINIKTDLTATAFSASAVDSFGEKADVTVSIDGTYQAGTSVTVKIVATDPAGNRAVREIAGVKAYDYPLLTCREDLTAIRESDALTPALFGATAKDSFGNACTVSVEANGNIKAGEMRSFTLTAEDEMGNRTMKTVSDVKIYGVPRIEIDRFLYADTDISFIALVYDSFGEELTPTVTASGALISGERVSITVKAEDRMGNRVEKSYEYVVDHDVCTYENGICTGCGVELQYTRKDNYVYFGEYQQTLKADGVTITDTKDSRGYYLGSDGAYYAKVVANPWNSSCTSANGTRVTDGATYYFKVEPIRWRILEEKGGEAFLLCDSIIANGAYDADCSNNYANSDVRAWLNGTFYETAFSDLQKEIILTTLVDNSASSTGYSLNPYACADTEDKVFLLSYLEVTNSAYGFSYEAREMKTSDYSRATGAYMSTSSSYDGNGLWWLRSPVDYHSYYARIVYDDGDVDRTFVNNTSRGLVPALRIRLS